MALIQTLTDSTNGVVATYWAIAQYMQQFPGDTAQLAVNGYVNKDIRAEGGSAVRTLSFNAPVDQSRAALYGWLKTQEAFIGAEDDATVFE